MQAGFTRRKIGWNWVHFVLQHFGMESSNVEWLHSVGQTASQHGIHVNSPEHRDRDQGRLISVVNEC